MYQQCIDDSDDIRPGTVINCGSFLKGWQLDKLSWWFRYIRKWLVLFVAHAIHEWCCSIFSSVQARGLKRPSLFSQSWELFVSVIFQGMKLGVMPPNGIETLNHDYVLINVISVSWLSFMSLWRYSKIIYLYLQAKSWSDELWLIQIYANFLQRFYVG